MVKFKIAATDFVSGVAKGDGGGELFWISREMAEIMVREEAFVMSSVAENRE